MKTLRRLLMGLIVVPIQACVTLALAVAEALGRLRAFHRPEPDAVPPDLDLCSIVILTWNGRTLLEQSLPAVLRAVAATGRPHEVLVADNGSDDDTLEWLASEHPAVDFLALGENLGFGEGNNRAVAQCRHEIVVLLNNDMVVQPDFLAPLLEPFRHDPAVFAVTSQIEFPEERRREETGNTRAGWRRGRLELAHAPLTRAHFRRRYLPVLWAGGGSSAFNRRRFLSLGGFASIYSPCYLEDTELSYRAWRRGWRVLLAAESRVLHRHRSSTARRFSPARLEQMIEQRKLFYLWRNFDIRSLLRHLVWSPADLFNRLSAGSYLGALTRIPEVLAFRFREPRRTRSDKRLLELTADPLLGLCELPVSPLSRTLPALPRLLIVSAYLPHEGVHGGAGRVYRVLRELAGAFDVTLVSFVENDREEQAARELDEVCHKVVTVPRGEFDRRSPFAYEPFEEFDSPEMRQRLRELLAERDFDLVDFEWTQMASFVDLFDSTPTLLTEVEVNWAAHRTRIRLIRPWPGRFHQWYRTLQTLYREVQLCRSVDCVVCVTDEDRSYLRPYLPEARIEVLNTGVDTSYFDGSCASAPEAGSLLYVGAFRHQPNVDAMLHFCREILPLIREKGVCPHLYIVGSGPGPEVRELARDPAITVTGFVEDIRDYYRLCETVIVPLRTGVGIRGKVLEAWAMRRPVVATRLACQGLRAEHGGNVLMADDAENFAEWIVALMRQPAFGRLLGTRGRATVEAHYGWETIGIQARNLYSSLLSGSYRGQTASAPAPLPSRDPGVGSR